MWNRHGLGVRIIGLLVAAACLGCQNVTRLDLTALGRSSWQRPDDVVRTLELAPGDRVADVGAGDGYFVPYLAEAVGDDGRVYAVDVEAEITEALEEKFASEPEVEVVLGEYGDPKLPDAALDWILLVNTYHHVEDRPAYFARLQSNLAPGGRIAIIEPNEDLTGVLSLFLDEGHTSKAGEIAGEMGQAGYRRVETEQILPIQVFEVFAVTSADVAETGR